MFEEQSSQNNALDRQKQHKEMNWQAQKQNQALNISKTPKSKRSPKSGFKSNSDEFTLEKTPKKKVKLFANEKQKNPNQLFGHWTHIQNKRYHWFLEIYHSHFLNRSLRRMDRIFTSMARFVSSREAQQCRSHHQKMQKKHKTFVRILMALREANYESKDDKLLKQEIEQANVQIPEPLLTEDYINENSHYDQNFPRYTVSEEKNYDALSPYMKEKRLFSQEKQPQIKQQSSLSLGSEDMIDEGIPVEIESSKNYFFNPVSHNQSEKNNIFDDEYEDNLDLGKLF